MQWILAFDHMVRCTQSRSGPLRLRGTAAWVGVARVATASSIFCMKKLTAHGFQEFSQGQCFEIVVGILGHPIPARSPGACGRFSAFGSYMGLFKGRCSVLRPGFLPWKLAGPLGLESRGPTMPPCGLAKLPDADARELQFDIAALTGGRLHRFKTRNRGGALPRDGARPNMVLSRRCRGRSRVCFSMTRVPSGGSAATGGARRTDDIRSVCINRRLRCDGRGQKAGRIEASHQTAPHASRPR